MFSHFSNLFMVFICKWIRKGHSDVNLSYLLYAKYSNVIGVLHRLTVCFYKFKDLFLTKTILKKNLYFIV